MEVTRQSGITLIELLVVMAIIAAISAVSFPSISAGLAGLRLTSAAGTTASFLTSAMNSVARHEEPAAIVIAPHENKLALFTARSGEKPQSELALPQGVTIEARAEEDADAPRRYNLYPGGAFPRIHLILRNEKGARRSIDVDPVTAVPDIHKVEDAP